MSARSVKQEASSASTFLNPTFFSRNDASVMEINQEGEDFLESHHLDIFSGVHGDKQVEIDSYLWSGWRITRPLQL
jgi:hypothetical protein